jgi:hypothetical protein
MQICILPFLLTRTQTIYFYETQYRDADAHMQKHKYLLVKTESKGAWFTFVVRAKIAISNPPHLASEKFVAPQTQTKRAPPLPLHVSLPRWTNAKNVPKVRTTLSAFPPRKAPILLQQHQQQRTAGTPEFQPQCQCNCSSQRCTTAPADEEMKAAGRRPGQTASWRMQRCGGEAPAPHPADGIDHGRSVPPQDAPPSRAPAGCLVRAWRDPPAIIREIFWCDMRLTPGAVVVRSREHFRARQAQAGLRSMAAC